MPRIKIETNQHDQRYWAYQPDQNDDFHNPKISLLRRAAWRADAKAARSKISASGFKAVRYGFARQADAIAAATEIEKFTGIAMMVFQHDYL